MRLGDGVTVEVTNPTPPVFVTPPAQQTVQVLPVQGPPGQDGPPGDFATDPDTGRYVIDGGPPAISNGA